VLIGYGRAFWITEVNARSVPLEDTPVQSGISSLLTLVASEPGHQNATNAARAECRLHIEVLDLQPSLAAESRVGLINGNKTSDIGVSSNNISEEDRVPSEHCVLEALLGRGDGRTQLLVLRQFADDTSTWTVPLGPITRYPSASAGPPRLSLR
jgi:hypothetical protein